MTRIICAIFVSAILTYFHNYMRCCVVISIVKKWMTQIRTCFIVIACLLRLKRSFSAIHNAEDFTFSVCVLNLIRTELQSKITTSSNCSSIHQMQINIPWRKIQCTWSIKEGITSIGLGHLDLLPFGLGHLDLLPFGLLAIWTCYHLDFCNAISLCCYRL
jgi:hypothetical protein